MIGGRGFLRFVLIAITKMDILYMFYHFQDPIKVIRRYEGYHYTRLESYYIIFYFETDWSRIRPLPSTTLRKFVIPGARSINGRGSRMIVPSAIMIHRHRKAIIEILFAQYILLLLIEFLVHRNKTILHVNK